MAREVGRRLGSVVLLACCLAAGGAFAQAPRYVATDLGDLPGGSDYSQAYGLNNAGQVVGGSRTTSPYGFSSGIEHPFLWTPTGQTARPA